MRPIIPVPVNFRKYPDVDRTEYLNQNFIEENYSFTTPAQTCAFSPISITVFCSQWLMPVQSTDIETTQKVQETPSQDARGVKKFCWVNLNKTCYSAYIHPTKGKLFFKSVISSRICIYHWRRGCLPCVFPIIKGNYRSQNKVKSITDIFLKSKKYINYIEYWGINSFP